jgi:DNA-binding transcriptional MerR regulator
MMAKKAVKPVAQVSSGPRATLKIGEVSERSGVGIETLRFYERSGLLDSPARTASGYRLYDAAVLDRLEFIKRAQMLGFSLHEIARIIAEKQAGHSPCDEVREIVRHRLGELDERLAQMKRYRRELAETLKGWEETGARAGEICGLIEGAAVGKEVSHAALGIRQKNGRKKEK